MTLGIMHLCNAAGQKVDAHGAVILEPATTEDAKVLRKRTIAELFRLSHFYANRSTFQPPTIHVADIKPDYFFYVDHHPFHGLPHENPLNHIETLEDLCLAFKSMKAKEMRNKIWSFPGVMSRLRL